MIDLDNLERLSRAATPGTWSIHNRSSDGADDPYLGYDIDGPEESWLERGSIATRADAEYIVAACNAVPELIARVRAMEKRNYELLVALRCIFGEYSSGLLSERSGDERMYQTTVGNSDLRDDGNPVYTDAGMIALDDSGGEQ